MNTQKRPSVEKVGTSKSTIVLMVTISLFFLAIEPFTGFLPEVPSIFEGSKVEGSPEMGQYLEKVQSFDIAEYRQTLIEQASTMEGQFESSESALKKIEEQYSQQQPTAEDVARALQGISNRLRAQAE